MDLCEISARIKAAREKAGMTQEDLAAVPETSPTHISVIERGVKSPKPETLVNIAIATILAFAEYYPSDSLKLSNCVAPHPGWQAGSAVTP